jgi:hypothetical protein
MANRKRSREQEVDPMYDMLFNMLIAFVFCFIIAFLSINPKAQKSGDIPAKAEFIITLSWPDNDPNDLDLWTQGPSGEVVWFRNREAGLMHLDRDDRGSSNNTIIVNGKKVDRPSFSLSIGDVVSIKEKTQKLCREQMESIPGHQVPGWIAVNPAELSVKCVANPTSDQIPFDVNTNLIVEFYR